MTSVTPRPLDLAALIRAHPFITIEQPPELWQIDADDVTFIRFFGELIAASLARNGGDLRATTINISNVVVEPSSGGPMPTGEFVAITSRGPGDWGLEVARRPITGADVSIVNSDLESAAAVAGAVWAYTRSLGNSQGSVTVLFQRRHP